MNDVLEALQNRDLRHKGGFCLRMRTNQSIVTCKLALLRCTLSL